MINVMAVAGLLLASAVGIKSVSERQIKEDNEIKNHVPEIEDIGVDNALGSVVFRTQAMVSIDGGIDYYDLEEGEFHPTDGFPASDKRINMDRKVDELSDLIRKGYKHVYIKLNSPGGYLKVGNKFKNLMIDAKEFYGVKFSCVVDEQASSMALVILTECNNRYATLTGKIMWHSISSVPGRVSIKQAVDFTKRLQKSNKKLWANTRKFFKDKFFDYHFHRDTIHAVADIARLNNGYLKLVRSVEYK